jgi:nucleoside-diphosphate-sugar epimerase
MHAVVTGGGGFLGRRVVELLRERDDQVTFLARGRYPEVEATGAVGAQVDIRDAAGLTEVFRGADTVFHIAAKAGFWGKREDYWSTNVDGTRNVIDACEAAGVKRLIYTSTPSVIGYEHDTENGAQDLPYAERHESYYPESKAAAEKMVLEANSRHLATVALRPHLIFGQRDALLLPRVVSRARDGRLLRVGDGTNLVDFTHVDNAAWAHLDAADALTSDAAPCAGKAYFISNDEPVNLWGWTNELLEQIGVPPVQKGVSLGAARALGWLFETAYSVFPLSGEPRITRFLANGFAKHHWYDMGPAKRDLGYRVRVPMAEATAVTAAYLKQWLESGKAAPAG